MSRQTARPLQQQMRSPGVMTTRYLGRKMPEVESAMAEELKLAKETITSLSSLSTALEFAEFDFTIVAARDGLRLSTHGLVLAARSPVFARMLKTDMQEKRTSECRITGYSSASLEAFLRVLHGNVDDLSSAVLGDLVELFDKYQIENVITAVGASRFEQLISVENAAQLLCTADKLHEKEVMDSAAMFILKNGAQVRESVKWKQLVANGTLNTITQALVGAVQT